MVLLSCHITWLLLDSTSHMYALKPWRIITVAKFIYLLKSCKDKKKDSSITFFFFFRSDLDFLSQICHLDDVGNDGWPCLSSNSLMGFMFIFHNSDPEVEVQLVNMQVSDRKRMDLNSCIVVVRKELLQTTPQNLKNAHLLITLWELSSTLFVQHHDDT